jgi:hypothetical protein
MNLEEEVIALKEEVKVLRIYLAERHIRDQYKDSNETMLREGLERVHAIQMALYELGNFEDLRHQWAFDWFEERKLREQKERNSKAPVMKDNESMEEFLLRTRQGPPC